MEKNLLKIFKLADLLNEKQNKVYAQLDYFANDSKTLEIAIRSKKDFSYIEKHSIQLTSNSIIKWDNIVELFENYIGGIVNE